MQMHLRRFPNVHNIYIEINCRLNRNVDQFIDFHLSSTRMILEHTLHKTNVTLDMKF